MLKMTWESWFKIALSGLPVAYTIFGVWFYWGDNPIPLLAPSLAFWGVVIVYYLFGHIYLETNKEPFWLAISTALLWLISNITSHNLGRFVSSTAYSGTLSVLGSKDFWYAYLCAVLSSGIGLWQFFKHEPNIMAQVLDDRAAQSEGK
jgi:hypothetical protein